MRLPAAVDWLRALTSNERLTFGAALGGWALDAMDVQIYSFVIPALMSLWNMSRTEAGIIGTSALISSAVGGWMGGWFADHFGRVRTLQAAILWFALFTLLSGLANNFNQLLAARSLMGFGFGGEWAAGAVLLGETIRSEHRGKALGLMQSGWAMGWGSAAVLYALLFSLLPSASAWRVMFFIGVTPAMGVFFMRRLVAEPAVYLRFRELTPKTDWNAFLDIFRRPLLKVTVLGALVGTGAQGGYNALSTWLPTFLRTERHLSVLDSSGYLAVLISGSFFGYVTGGYLSDRIGRRMTFLVFAISSGLLVFTYTSVPFGNTSMLVMGFPLGFSGAGVFSGMGAFYTEQFPTHVRGVGQGFSYNVGRASGAVFPALVGVLSGKMGLGAAIGIFGSAAYTLMAVAAFLLPETKGKILRP